MKKPIHEQLIRQLCRGAYDLQKLRIQMGNRITIKYKELHGLTGEDAKTDEEERITDKILLLLIKEYKEIMLDRKLVPTFKQFKPKEDALINDYAFFILVNTYAGILNNEVSAFNNLKKVLELSKIYPWLNSIRGVGHMMSAVIIGEIDIFKSKYSSSIHAYAGLDTVNGEGRSRKKEHLVEKKYTNDKGEEKITKGITFNPWLKTKLIGVLATSFLKQPAEKCEYRKIYDDYKNRIENHPKHKDKTKGHRHNMAMRYMIKIFLIHLYAEWKKVEGLEVQPPYHEAKLGLKHKIKE